MTTASQDYIETAQQHGYNKGYTVDQLEEIGMAIERAVCDWSWYAAGDTTSKQYQNVVCVFEYTGKLPTERATIMAYAEGMANEFGNGNA